jgi:hypothetical protein
MPAQAGAQNTFTERARIRYCDRIPRLIGGSVSTDGNQPQPLSVIGTPTCGVPSGPGQKVDKLLQASTDLTRGRCAA